MIVCISVAHAAVSANHVVVVKRCHFIYSRHPPTHLELEALGRAHSPAHCTTERSVSQILKQIVCFIAIVQLNPNMGAPTPLLHVRIRKTSGHE